MCIKQPNVILPGLVNLCLSEKDGTLDFKLNCNQKFKNHVTSYTNSKTFIKSLLFGLNLQYQKF